MTAADIKALLDLIRGWVTLDATVVAGIIAAWWLLRRENKRLSANIEELKNALDAKFTAVFARLSETDEANADLIATSKEISANLGETAQRFVCHAAPPAASQGVSPPPGSGSGPGMPTLPPSERPDAALREALRSEWAKTRQSIEAIIQSIVDGRIRPKYDKISRYDYREVITKLVEDKKLSVEAAASALKMQTIFNSYRSGRKILDETTLREFANLAKDFARETPAE